MNTLMTYNGETGDLVCFTPTGEEVLRIVEPKIKKAHAISNAVQEAYRKGSIQGRLAMQNSIERHMDEINAK